MTTIATYYGKKLEHRVIDSKSRDPDIGILLLIGDLRGIDRPSIRHTSASPFPLAPSYYSAMNIPNIDFHKEVQMQCTFSASQTPKFMPFSLSA
jgi:hypothetical protein